MPKHPYVINLENNIMSTYHYRMHQEDLAKQFGRWYRIMHGNKKLYVYLEFELMNLCKDIVVF